MSRLKGCLFNLLCLLLIKNTHQQPAIEWYHYNWKPWLSPYVDGTDYQIPGKQHTPDYRLEDRLLEAHKADTYRQYYRPIRMSPLQKQVKRYRSVSYYEKLINIGCYCCTVYKRLTPLGGCALLTKRHVLTTATSTELILGPRRHFPTLDNILGLWYDNTWEKTFNSSMYATPARIHYHPEYLRPHAVNISHPLPVVMDLSVWALTHEMTYWINVCGRASSTRSIFKSSIPKMWAHLHIVGFQWIMAWKRRPTPFHKYLLRTQRSHFVPCPKQGWGWFHCLRAPWMKLGVESGGGLHLVNEDDNLNDGLLGLNAFSVQLRTKQIVHYFQTVDSHKVLEFLYVAYMGTLDYEYLDTRFFNTKTGSPIEKPWYSVYKDYREGAQTLNVRYFTIPIY